MAALKKKLPGFNDKLDLNNNAQVNKLIDDVKANNTTAKKLLCRNRQFRIKFNPLL